MYDAVLVKVDDGLHDRSQVVTRCMNKNTGDIVNYLDKFADDNYLDKFADDTYLIVPSSQRHTVHDELDHISTWAKTNNLRLNTSKSKELFMFRRKRFVPPPLITGIERVTNM